MLVVDDHEVFRRHLARSLERRGYQVRAAANYDQAVELAQAESPELAVVDLRMPGRSGLELLQELKRIDATTKVVMLTGFGSIATAVDAMRLGATKTTYQNRRARTIFWRPLPEPRARCAGNRCRIAKAQSLARAEWEHIHRVLSDCGGVVSEAARRLRIQRSSLKESCRRWRRSDGEVGEVMSDE